MTYHRKQEKPVMENELSFEGLNQEEVDEFNAWLDGISDEDFEDKLGKMFQEGFHVS